MALSGNQVTGIGILGFPGRSYSGFTAKSESVVVVVEVPNNGAGGAPYGRRPRNKSRVLKSLSEYDERIKVLLEIEKREKLEEKARLKKNLVKKEKIPQAAEQELQVLIVKEAITKVEHEIAKVNSNLQLIKSRSITNVYEDELLLLMLL